MCAQAAQPPPAPPLVWLLGRALEALTDRLHEQLVAAGFDDHRLSHDKVMPYVPPGGITLAQLSRRAGITKQAMAELVQDLETKGYLRRRLDPADRRVRVIEFTERGWSAVGTALAGFAGMEKELQSRWGHHDFTLLRAMLEDIARDTAFGQGDRGAGESTSSSGSEQGPTHR
jgi:DNA-binding MarR family transcriptional regulator